jgi:hypothetical protein
MVNFREWTVCHISLFVTFVISGLFINLIQAILFFTVGLLSRKLFRKINFYFNWMINAQVKIKAIYLTTPSIWIFHSNFNRGFQIIVLKSNSVITNSVKTNKGNEQNILIVWFRSF